MSGQVFDDLYLRNGWNGRESRSGPGSGRVPTQVPAQWLLGLIQEHQVRSVLDIGCGDSLWMPDLPRYLGIDVSRVAIRRSKRAHPDRRYMLHDAVQSLPRGVWDLVLIRDVLQHLPMADGQRLLGNVLRRKRTRFLVASTYTGQSTRHPDPVNTDIRVGECYCNVLTEPPFSMPQPTQTCPDGWDYTQPGVVRDPAKHLGLWELA